MASFQPIQARKKKESEISRSPKTTEDVPSGLQDHNRDPNGPGLREKDPLTDTATTPEEDRQQLEGTSVSEEDLEDSNETLSGEVIPQEPTDMVTGPVEQQPLNESLAVIFGLADTHDWEGEMKEGELRLAKNVQYPPSFPPPVGSN